MKIKLKRKSKPRTEAERRAIRKRRANMSSIVKRKTRRA